MNSDRRLFLRRAAGSAAVFGAGLFSIESLFGQSSKTNKQTNKQTKANPNSIIACPPDQPNCQEGPPPPPPCTEGAVCNVSQAIVKDSTTTFVGLVNKIKANTVQATDFASASTAAQMLFDNLQEAGVFTQEQAAAQSCSQSANNCPAPLTSAQLNQLYQQLLNDGANVTLTDVEIANITGSDLTTAASTFQSQGSPGLTNFTVQTLNNSAQEMQSGGGYVAKERRFDDFDSCELIQGLIFFLRSLLVGSIGCPDCLLIVGPLLLIAIAFKYVYNC